MNEHPSNVNTALLVQLLEQVGGLRQEVGGIKTQLEHGSHRFESIDDQLKEVKDGQKDLQNNLAPLVIAVPAIDTRVKSVEDFIGKKAAPVIAVASAIVALALWLIVISSGAVINWLKGTIGTHLHWS